MKSIVERLAKRIDFSIENDIAYGRVNDILFNIKFIESEKPKPEDLSEGLIRCQEKNPLAYIISPKYETAAFDVFASRDTKVDLVQLNDFIETYYFIYKVYKMNYIDDHFSFLLDKNHSFNIKMSYISDFMNDFSVHLKDLGYSSSCIKCESNDNLTNQAHHGLMAPICTICVLKDTKL